MTNAPQVGTALVICPACGRSFDLPVRVVAVRLYYGVLQVTFNDTNHNHECERS